MPGFLHQSGHEMYLNPFNTTEYSSQHIEISLITIVYYQYQKGSKTLHKSIINLITSNIVRKLLSHESLCSATFKNPFK